MTVFTTVWVSTVIALGLDIILESIRLLQKSRCKVQLELKQNSTVGRKGNEIKEEEMKSLNNNEGLN